MIQTVGLGPHRLNRANRPDWFTHDGLPTWGYGRLFLLGTHALRVTRLAIAAQARAGG